VPEARLLLREGKAAEHDLLVAKKVKTWKTEPTNYFSPGSMYSALAAAKQVTNGLYMLLRTGRSKIAQFLSDWAGTLKGNDPVLFSLCSGQI
jgi:hypothetical protein